MSDKTELLPCPFCGGAARFEFVNGWRELVASHINDCLMSGDSAEMAYRESEGVRERMASKWNRRATIQPTAASEHDFASDGVCRRCCAYSSKAHLPCVAPVAPADAVRDARNEQDAARYRFLRDSENNNECVSMLHDYLDAPHQIDRAIDAAIARETPRAEITTAAPIPNPPMTHLEAFGLFGEYIDKEPAK